MEYRLGFSKIPTTDFSHLLSSFALFKLNWIGILLGKTTQNGSWNGFELPNGKIGPDMACIIGTKWSVTG